MLDLIAEDIRRKQNNYVMKKSFINTYLKVLLQFGTISVVLYRIGSCFLRVRFPIFKELLQLIYWLMSKPVIWLTGIDINPNQQIGKGFVIHNFSNIIVDAESIGDNLTLNQGVTIGPDISNNGKPRLGSNVFIGSGAVILGDIDVGDDVVVAANAVITKNIAAKSVVAGNPGIVIKKNLNSDYVSNTPARINN